MLKSGPYIEHIFGEKIQDLYKSHKGWLTCAVHHSIAWPEKDVAVTYEGRQYFLRGLKDQSDKIEPACISVKTETGDDLNCVLTDIYKFTSALGWFKGGYVDVIGHINGSHPSRYGGGNQMFAPYMASGKYGFNCNFMPLINDDATRIALAFWREGLKLEHIHVPYSFLSFYKVIESQFVKGKEKGLWITNAIPLLHESEAKIRINELEIVGTDVSTHLYESCRCAVAHASMGSDVIDPDIPADKRRIQKDLDIIKALAKKYIREVLNIPDEMDIFRGRNNLEPIFEYLRDSEINELQSGRSLFKKQIGVNGLKVSVSEWPHSPIDELADLELVIESAHNGVISLQAFNKYKDLALTFTFNFLNGKAHTELELSGFLPVQDGGRKSSVIAFLKYQKSAISNGIIEIQFPNKAKVICEVVIPVNIDIARTFEAIEKEIIRLEKT